MGLIVSVRISEIESKREEEGKRESGEEREGGWKER